MAPSVKDWSPDPVRDMIAILDRHTADSARYAEEGGREALEQDTGKMMGVAIPYIVYGAFPNRPPETGFESFHVTDNPARVMEALRSGGDLMKTQPYWLGRMCPGLYVSTSTQYWTRSVSSKRYAFLNTISEDQRKLLGKVILSRLAENVGTGYITENEHDVAVRDVTYWITGRNLASVNLVIGQPYNVNVAQLAVQLGIIPKIDEPDAARVIFHGRYLRYEDREAIQTAVELARLSRRQRDVTQKEVCLSLAFHGWDGLYTKSGFSHEPELVIMNAARVTEFGRWTRGSDAP